MNIHLLALISSHIFDSSIFRILATSLSVFCLIVLNVQAAPILVTNTNDDGTGSLRQALATANDGDTIQFGVTGTIALTTGELLVNKSISITGPGPADLAVDASLTSRVFHIGSGLTVTISGLTISNGNADGDGGGGIQNDHATLAIDNCTISGNHADWGGGVNNRGGNGGATLTVTNSTFSGNSAAAPYSSGAGGAILNDGYDGNATLTISNSTLSGNWAGIPTAYGWGGGIYSDGTYGGATVTLNNSTFSGNWAGTFGGGIYNGHSTVTIANTILKTGLSGENIYNSGGTITSNGYNLSNDNGGAVLTATGDQINTDPLLGPLQNNGGSTFTHALLPGSPASDSGNPNFNAPPYYDQRGSGYNRLANGRIDIGAFEKQVAAPTYAAQVQPPINPDGTSTFNVRRGVVPVKFNLTQGGFATCNLPMATIAVTRTAGGVVGPINESVYNGNADQGTNFRIESCQYVYNLNSRAFGVGTYRLDILIADQIVGSAVFTLN